MEPKSAGGGQDGQMLKVRCWIMGVKKRRWRRWKKKLFRWRKVRCIECGFLTSCGLEVRESDRVLIKAATDAGSLRETLPANPRQLDCHRGLWVGPELNYTYLSVPQAISEATRKRFCRGYHRHEKGWAPAEHRDLVLRRRDRWYTVVSGLLFALLGAGLTLLAQWVAKLLSLN